VAGENGIVSGMAGRYATALFELAVETKSLDQLHADLAAFETMLAASPELTRLVRSPVFGADEQARALDAVLDKAGISGSRAISCAWSRPTAACSPCERSSAATRRWSPNTRAR
jgi:F-type H+-transporting ATPase subunit delta